jgi:hypothetical protein
MGFVDTKYELGQIVFLITDEQQRERMVTGIRFHANGAHGYDISIGDESNYHYECEISGEIDTLKKVK